MESSTKIKTMASASILALLLACGGDGGVGVGSSVTQNASLPDQWLQMFLSSVSATATVVTAAM
jgi:hypothetical protein